MGHEKKTLYQLLLIKRRLVLFIRFHLHSKNSSMYLSILLQFILLLFYFRLCIHNTYMYIIRFINNKDIFACAVHTVEIEDS